MNHNYVQIIGAIAFALNVWGNLELTKVGNRGHIIRLCSNACWLVYSPLIGAWALLANHATFAGINVLGFVRWRKLERDGHIGKNTKIETEYWVTKFRHMSTCRCELPILFCNKCMPEMITSIQQNRRL